jgi:hypothetical protein
MIRVLVIVIAVAGCGGTKRNTQQYRTDSERVLETRHAQIESCYQKVLEADPKAQGTLTVNFTVERKTGVFKNATIDAGKSNAPEALVNCVMGALAGLTLLPADKNEGRGTFVYKLAPSA